MPLAMRAFLEGVAKSVVTTVLFFALAEVALRGAYLVRNSMVRFIPLPYALGDDYGPIPPWLDRLEILVPDDTLIWHSLPNARRTYVDIFSPARTARDRTALLRRFVPTLPEEFRNNPTWQVALNSHGDRMAEYTPARVPGTIRIACIGDSWTFGMNVNPHQTYPSRVLSWLRDRHPDQRFEVLNFGVLGYSSFQGLQLLKRRVLDLRPDILVIGFGMNDSDVAGYRDRDMVTDARPSLGARIKAVAPDLEFWKLLKHVARVMTFTPKPAGEYLKQEADAKSGPVDYDELDPWTRVSPRDYDLNLREMIRLQTSRGGTAILLDNELWEESPYRQVLRRISADLRVPLVDSLRLVADGKRDLERDLENRLGLSASNSPDPFGPGSPAGPKGPALYTTVVFRVSRGAFDVPRAMSIVGTDPQLGNLTPNTALMHDDGTAGDERAGDGVWSYAATFPTGARLFYVYTNSGERGRWEGLDVPAIRRIMVPASNGHVYLPIETFGRLYMQADNWHPDAYGYDLIARAVADEIGKRQP